MKPADRVVLAGCRDHQGDEDRLGYLAWHDRAQASSDAGIKQAQCPECSRYYFPWELVANNP